MGEQGGGALFKLLADAVMALHFAWIVFMISGGVLAAAAFRYERLFRLARFRTVHLIGVLFTALLAAAGLPCPLTLLENRLNALSGSGAAYPGSFIAAHIGGLVYPGLPPLALIVPTILLALFSAAVFAFRPPRKK